MTKEYVTCQERRETEMTQLRDMPSGSISTGYYGEEDTIVCIYLHYKIKSLLNIAHNGAALIKFKSTLSHSLLK